MNAVRYLLGNKTNLDASLVLSRTGNTSYKETYLESMRISKILENFSQKRVFLFAEKSPFWIFSYFGVIASGNVCVPIDTRLTNEEISELVMLVKPVMIITEAKNTAKFEKCKIPIVDEITAKNYEVGNIKEVNEDDLASIMFTSGSSGKPKGVMITHKNIIANTNSIIEYLGLSDKDIMEVVLPFYYCYGLSLLHTHARVGGKIVLNNKFLFPETVSRDIEDFKCTGFAGVPSHFEILVHKTRFLERKFASLRYLTQAGGKMSDETILKIHEKMKPTKLFVMYGQTEATARLSYLPPEKLPEKVGSIGKGIPGVELIVRDTCGNPVKTGELGELTAKGDNIMKGYFEDKKSTDEKIVDGWLKTGDRQTRIYLYKM